MKLVIFSVLISDPSRYLWFTNTEQFPNQITHRRRVEVHPRSHRALAVHYPMKVSLKTFARIVICQFSGSICLLMHSIIESGKRDPEKIGELRVAE
jgi:hypothetical protein